MNTAVLDKVVKVAGLNAEEKQSLKRCEELIQGHFETYKAAGSALAEIRDKRLYRESYDSFEKYCWVKWNMSKTQANRLVAAASVVTELVRTSPDIADTVGHLTESAVRPLTKLPPKVAAKVMRKVAGATPTIFGITAKQVEKVARQVSPGSFRAVTKDHKSRSDLIRRSELLDEIRGWETLQRGTGKMAKMTGAEAVKAIRSIINKL